MCCQQSPSSSKLEFVLSKIGAARVGQVADGLAGVRMDTGYHCRMRHSPVRHSGLGRPLSKSPAQAVGFTIHGGEVNAASSRLKRACRANPEHPKLPRLWARARVECATGEIEREGGDGGFPLRNHQVCPAQIVCDSVYVVSWQRLGTLGRVVISARQTP